MLIYIFYILNVLLLLSALLTFRLSGADQQFSFSLLRSLICLPLLAVQYLYLSYEFVPQLAQSVLFSENVFAVIWVFAAQRLYNASIAHQSESKTISYLELLIGALSVLLGYFCLERCEIMALANGSLVFRSYGAVYFYALFTLGTMLFMAWRLEGFWRNLPMVRRWEYKFPLVSSYLICGTMIWAASYRITYLRIVLQHMILVGALMVLAWGMMLYAVAHYRLLNRKFFISRRIVYSSVAPLLFACYFLAVGIVSLLMRQFNWPLRFALFWFILAVGLSGTGLYVCSGKLRRRVYFFISTHFYVNKYEYRDEWLAFSQLLQGAFSTEAIVNVLREILLDSLYTTEIKIWIGDEINGYSLVPLPEETGFAQETDKVPGHDSFVAFLKVRGHFYLEDGDSDIGWQKVPKKVERFLRDRALVLATPLSISDQFVGWIGVGPEYTGGRYGHDDFDLLTALGTQAASSLLAVRMAEELSRMRQREAWNRLSAFVLHDIKNASTMLSLMRDNAPEHIDNPDFQRDMLETIDNALKRMSKVQRSLASLKGEISPQFQSLQVGSFLEDFRSRTLKSMPQIAVQIDCAEHLHVFTDPEILFRILENLALNALEAGATKIELIACPTSDHGEVMIEMLDNGSGIPQELLPDGLFEPFRTTKSGGSGIGLWQVKELVGSVRGRVSSKNVAGKGAAILLGLPPMGVEKIYMEE